MRLLLCLMPRSLFSLLCLLEMNIPIGANAGSSRTRVVRVMERDALPVHPAEQRSEILCWCHWQPICPALPAALFAARVALNSFKPPRGQRSCSSPL